ncbi:MAG: cupin domain-containing protein [Candidatus Kapabacteria bacterium]|nr:cupin domain-containing protein [Candidatus Kapabacteria bacterium]
MNEINSLKNAEYWIEKLRLQQHIEGGYFTEIYRSKNTIKKENLPNSYNSDRCFLTSIYYLLKSGQKSLFHKIKSDEIWHFFAGSPLKLLSIYPNNEFHTFILGNDFEKNEIFQVGIPANSWIAATPIFDNSYSLVGCTVAPGFEFSDLEIANRDFMLKNYPHLYDLIIIFSNE